MKYLLLLLISTGVFAAQNGVNLENDRSSQVGDYLYGTPFFLDHSGVLKKISNKCNGKFKVIGYNTNKTDYAFNTKDVEILEYYERIGRLYISYKCS